jgi:hypothetical protein
MEKGKTHTRIIGKFGEIFVASMLSRSGFSDVIIADHIGVDVLAYREGLGKLGISVKSRTRAREGSENESVNLFRQDDQLLEEVCMSFGWEPWIAVYSETEEKGDLYLASLKTYRDRYNSNSKMLVWNLSTKNREAYKSDVSVMHFQIQFTKNNWFKNRPD